MVVHTVVAAFAEVTVLKIFLHASKFKDSVFASVGGFCKMYRLICDPQLMNPNIFCDLVTFILLETHFTVSRSLLSKGAINASHQVRLREQPEWCSVIQF